MSTERRAKRVTAINLSDGHQIHGVQDTITGTVYPFDIEIAERVAASVNDGSDNLNHYASMFNPDSYVLEEVTPKEIN